MLLGQKIFKELFKENPELWLLALKTKELPEINITIGNKWRMNYQADIREQKEFFNKQNV